MLGCFSKLVFPWCSEASLATLLWLGRALPGSATAGPPSQALFTATFLLAALHTGHSFLVPAVLSSFLKEGLCKTN